MQSLSLAIKAPLGWDLRAAHWWLRMQDISCGLGATRKLGSVVLVNAIQCCEQSCVGSQEGFGRRWDVQEELDLLTSSRAACKPGVQVCVIPAPVVVLMQVTNSHLHH